MMDDYYEYRPDPMEADARGVSRLVSDTVPLGIAILVGVSLLFLVSLRLQFSTSVSAGVSA